MGSEWKLFTGAAAFATVVSGIYWAVSYEHAGTTMLRPSDRPDAGPGDDAGESVYYPSASVWPFVAATGSVVLGFGLVFGPGVGSLGVLVLATAIAGYAAEANAKR